MITLKTLIDTPLDLLTAAFNKAFSDYVVPFSLTTEQLKERIYSDSINLELSVGAFENDMLIGFILHGEDVIDNTRCAYNAGTGVIPEKRGDHLTAKMYEFILPYLKKQNVERIILQVISTNVPALKTYSQLGFDINRSLNCFKGSLLTGEKDLKLEIRSMPEYNWPLLKSFWDFSPSWQNALTAVEKLKQFNISIGAYDGDRLLGYLIYNPKTKRVHQLAVDKSFRRMGIGRQLFNYLNENDHHEIGIINVDDSSVQTTAFIQSLGLHCFIKQYEMQLKLLK